MTQEERVKGRVVGMPVRVTQPLGDLVNACVVGIELTERVILVDLVRVTQPLEDLVQG